LKDKNFIIGLIPARRALSFMKNMYVFKAARTTEMSPITDIWHALVFHCIDAYSTE
jgi:hypothetical protein